MTRFTATWCNHASRKESGRCSSYVMFVTALFTLLGLLAPFAKASSNDLVDNNHFVVAGYLPDYRFYINLNQTALKLTDLIIFSTDFDATASSPDQMFSHQSNSVCCLDQAHLKKAQQARAFKLEQQGQDLRLWLTVGGAGRSAGFYHLLQNSARFEMFSEALVQVCQEFGLTGIDLDYQGLNRNTELREFTNMVQHVSFKLKRHGYLLSTTLRPGMWLPAEVYEAVSRVHLMTYDHPHSYLDKNVKPAVEATIRERVPPTKIVLGIPAYGRHAHNPNEVKTFAEIYDEAGSNDGESTTDTRSNWKGFVFDSPQIVRKKADYAREMGLHGVFLWELGQDKADEWFAPSGFLLQAAAHHEGNKDEKGHGTQQEEL